MAEPAGTRRSTSAIATRTRASPPGSVSATSIWSRSRDSTSSIEDQSSERRSGTPGEGVGSGVRRRAATSASTAGSKSARKPRSSIAWRAAARRLRGGVTRDGAASGWGARKSLAH